MRTFLIPLGLVLFAISALAACTGEPEPKTKADTATATVLTARVSEVEELEARIVELESCIATVLWALGEHLHRYQGELDHLTRTGAVRQRVEYLGFTGGGLNKQDGQYYVAGTGLRMCSIPRLPT